MNPKLQTFLHTAWTEPRHFFFWLALMSASGFGAAITVVGIFNPGPLLTSVALACILGLAISVVAYLLAWIPLCRRGLSWLLARRFLVLAGVVTLIALFYAVEDWRGRSAWQSFKSRQESMGERFDFAGLVPAVVPAERNFFETPLWTDLHFERSNGIVTWSDTNWGSRAVFNAFGPNGGNAPSTGNWTKSQRVDLQAWQAYYRSTNNVFATHDGRPPTNYFPMADAPQAPALDVLRALSRYDDNRGLLIETAARPEARFWIDYDAGPAMLLPHLARVKSCSQYLSLHANASLKAGDKPAALEDVKLLFRLIDASRMEPLLISHLVRMAVLQIGLQPVWEGLADRQWTDADLSFLEGELARLDFLADYKIAMNGERACNLWAMDYIRRTGLGGWEELIPSDQSSSTSGELGKFFGQMGFQLIPAGWFDQNKLSTCRLHQNYIQPAVDHGRHVISPKLVHASEMEFGRKSRPPYAIFSRLLAPSYAKSVEKFARTQSSVDLARAACAIERYRLANGKLPETLAELSPQFLPSLPLDVIDGNPLRYRRSDDGQFILYSIGWNETDDAGKVELTKQGNLDIQKGDWAWRYSAG